MKLSKTQFLFIVNCDVEQIVCYLKDEGNKSLVEAFGMVYNSKLYTKLTDYRTGLFLKSPDYIYDCLKEELSNK